MSAGRTAKRRCHYRLAASRQTKGYTRYIGYSGDGPASVYAIECDQFDTLATSINIADQEAIDITVQLASLRQIGVIAKGPVANAVWRNSEMPTIRYYQTYWDRLRLLQITSSCVTSRKRSCQRHCVLPLPSREFTLQSSGLEKKAAGKRTPNC